MVIKVAMVVAAFFVFGDQSAGILLALVAPLALAVVLGSDINGSSSRFHGVVVDCA
jgi:hypothetical protein